MQVEAVLFDLFDTLLLLESDEIYYNPCLRKLYESLVKNGMSIPFEDFRHTYFEVRDKFYSESRESLEEPHFNVRVSQTLQRLGYDIDISNPIVIKATMAFADEFMRYVALDNEAIDLLRKLCGRYKLGIVSNFGIPECGRELLKRFHLMEFFDVIVISGEVNQRKPSPKIFKKALKVLNVDASRTVFVGDMLDLDIVGPKRVGMKTVLIERKPLQSKIRVKPDRTIKNLSQLSTVLEEFLICRQ
jgi:putative hydrolase of the HAD superfamily